ncbi:MAG: lactate racemase domain-containing protein [Nocardioidaceae bacterium]
MATTAGSADTRSAITIGDPGAKLTESRVQHFISDQLSGVPLDGRSVCVLVPDATRSCPLPLLMHAVHHSLHERASSVTLLVALGTHAAMTDEQLAGHLGYPVADPHSVYPGMTVLNHEWWRRDCLVSVGSLSADLVHTLSGGRLRAPVDVRINKAVVEHDVTLVVGPVFPHEVVGYSGGNKYFFPGVAGPEFIDLSHWLGALITSSEIIGATGVTPVRALINEAVSLVPTEKYAFCVVPDSGTRGLHAISFGDTQSAWADAAGISAETNVRYLQAPVRRVVSVVPARYDEIWTAAKGFYKVEPVVADGGEVILYAPHVTQISTTHPEILEVGYHCRDYFVKQWDTFSHFPWGVLAHCTHLRGSGSYDEQHGEHSRVKVTLATGIPEKVVRSVNLSYLDPTSVDLAAERADPDTLYVPDAGEVLYRLR